eukprot:COSAG02_NODE_8169_length_2679_cov_3.563178_3_plen_127_part_00
MPRGTNNRVDEQNTNRNNNNRLFDSQNNNKGGYSVGVDTDDYTDGVRKRLTFHRMPSSFSLPHVVRACRAQKSRRKVRCALGIHPKGSSPRHTLASTRPRTLLGGVARRTKTKLLRSARPARAPES